MSILNLFSLFEPGVFSKSAKDAAEKAAAKAAKDAAAKAAKDAAAKAAKEAAEKAAKEAAEKAAKDAAEKAAKDAAKKAAKDAAATTALKTAKIGVGVGVTAGGAALLIDQANKKVDALNNKVFTIVSIGPGSSGNLLVTYSPSTVLSQGANVVFTKTLIPKLDNQSFTITTANNSTSFTIAVDSKTYLACSKPGVTSPDPATLNICDASFTYQTAVAIEAAGLATRGATDVVGAGADVVSSGLGPLGDKLGNVFPDLTEWMTNNKNVVYFILFLILVFVLWKVGVFSLIFSATKKNN